MCHYFSPVYGNGQDKLIYFIHGFDGENRAAVRHSLGHVVAAKLSWRMRSNASSVRQYVISQLTYSATNVPSARKDESSAVGCRILASMVDPSWL